MLKMPPRKQVISSTALGENNQYLTGKQTLISNRKPLGELSNKIKPIRKIDIKSLNEQKAIGLRKSNSSQNVHLNKIKPLHLIKNQNEKFPTKVDSLPRNRPALVVPQIPLGIAIIDNETEENELLIPQYVRYIYRYLLHLESLFPIKENYLSHQEITGKMRSVLIDWIFNVASHYKLMQETYQITVAIIDRYLQIEKRISKEKLQLIGVSSLFISSKIEEIEPIEVSDLVYISDGACTSKDILMMEMYILKILNFNLGIPVPISFVRRYSKASKANPLQHHLSKYFIDLAMMYHELSHFKPSLIAAAATYISLCVVNEKISQSLWNSTLAFYSEYQYSDIQDAVKVLARAILKTSNGKLQAVRTKYASTDCRSVSTMAKLFTENRFLSQLC